MKISIHCGYWCGVCKTPIKVNAIFTMHAYDKCCVVTHNECHDLITETVIEEARERRIRENKEWLARKEQ